MPLSPEVRRALEALNHGPLKSRPEKPAPPAEDAAPPPDTFGRPAPLPPTRAMELPALPESGSRALEALIPGAVVEAAGRSCFLHERAIRTPSWRNVPVVQLLLDHFENPPGEERHPLAALLTGPPEDALFLDIETCGLSGGPLFLVGVISVKENELLLRQYFARHYSEEPAVLALSHDLLRQHPALVTFNGKTFDLPYIINRATYYRLPVPEQDMHVDLLQLARRKYRGRLPDCRLQTLERHLCRRHRVDDIPGELMARAYHDFVRTGDATDMRKVFHHNLMDLVTMVEVLCALASMAW